LFWEVAEDEVNGEGVFFLVFGEGDDGIGVAGENAGAANAVDGFLGGLVALGEMSAEKDGGTSFDGDAVEVAARAKSWLQRLPCPPIALITTPMRLKGFDLSVSSPAEAERIEAAAANNPVASTVLVQALRVIEGLPLQAGLVVESLAFAALQQGHEFQDWLARLPPPRTARPLRLPPTRRPC